MWEFRLGTVFVKFISRGFIYWTLSVSRQPGLIQFQAWASMRSLEV